ncbi:hypothetical protein [Plantactinospora soyae]|uniref:Uncharacterized protein n=1 Tax=Plantactinospora soyae TaxID=1544732 RepID=A0A927MBU1_9ACTN|nr:hypothetical protein [Plantactinospora soyae]MBE1490271.1 hypothetical protein [Plantactinospora soyae]
MTARVILRTDALFEVILAACCLALAVTAPRSGLWRLPDSVPPAVAGGAGLTFLAAGALLWRLSRRPGRRLLFALAAANAATAVVAGVWWGAPVDAGSGTRLLLAASVAGLAALAVSQATVAFRQPTRFHRAASR